MVDPTPIDIGTLAPHQGPPASLRVALPPLSQLADFRTHFPDSFRVQLLRHDPAVPQGVFVRGCRVLDETATFGSIQPGRYRAQLMLGTPGGRRTDGEPLGELVDIAVADDGTVTPAAIDWSKAQASKRR